MHFEFYDLYTNFSNKKNVKTFAIFLTFFYLRSFWFPLLSFDFLIFSPFCLFTFCFLAQTSLKITRNLDYRRNIAAESFLKFGTGVVDRNLIGTEWPLANLIHKRLKVQPPTQQTKNQRFGMSRICQKLYLFIPQMEILKSNNYFKFLTVMSSIVWMPLSSIIWTWKLGKLIINLLWISLTQAFKSS